MELIPGEPAIIKSALSLSPPIDRPRPAEREDFDEEGFCRRLIASMIEFSEIGAETIYIISAPDRAGGGRVGSNFIVCLGLRSSRSFAADKAHLGPIHITVAVALLRRIGRTE